MALYAALDSPACEYAHQWEKGDLILANNLTVAHRTGPGAHASVDEVGTLPHGSPSETHAVLVAETKRMVSRERMTRFRDVSLNDCVPLQDYV